MTAAATLLGFFALLLQPQDQERAREFEKQRWLQERIAQPEPEGESFFDFGLWFRPQYYAWVDGAGQNRSQVSCDLRPWIDYRSAGHTLYARLLARYVDWAPGDSPDGDDEVSDFDVDLAFWQYDFAETTEMGATQPVAFLRAGRIYYVLGSGLAFQGRGDGILAGWRLGPARLTSFLAITPINTEDLDQSRPNPDETRRIFATLLIEGTFSSRHVPYFFGVIQRDRNQESPDDPFQDFDWDSEYWGAGARGLFARGLTYLVEAIYGTGERVPDAPGAPAEDIKSWAAVAELAYALGGAHELRLEAAFYIGSGDKDRVFIGNTILGNTPGTDDRAFTAFGFIPAGLVLNPLIANIKVHKLGLYGKLVNPRQVFESGALDGGIELYYYSKHRDGPISDPFMDLTRRRIGWEIDLIVNWTLASDLAVTMRGGYFKPASNGGAPLVDDPRIFALIGVVYSY